MSFLVNAFRGEVGKKKDNKMKAETEFNVFYSTGFLSFDFRNGSIIHARRDGKPFKYYGVGITDGSMNTLIGRSGCGKTTWAVQAAANIIRPFENGSVYYEDIEGGITEARKVLLTGFSSDELRDRMIHRNTGITAENFYERVKMIHDIKDSNRAEFEYDTGLYDEIGNRIFKLQPTVVILDSLALLMPGKYSDEDDLSGQMAATAAAKTNSAIFKRLIPLIKNANIILFIINHINMKVEINAFARTKAQVSYLKPDETLPGGNAAIYLSNTIIRFDDNTKLKESEGFGIRGNLVDLCLVKSRTNAAGGETATLVFNQDTGYDPELSLLVMLKNAKLITGAGAWFSLSNRPDLKFSQKQFKEKLSSDPEFNQAFQELAFKCLAGGLEDRTISRDLVNTSDSVTGGIMSMLTQAV